MNFLLKRQYEQEIERLQAEVKTARDDYNLTQRALYVKHKEVLKIEKEARELHDKVRELKALVRDQTEADILLNALRIIGLAPEHKPKHEKLIGHQEQLMDRAEVVRNMQDPSAYTAQASIPSSPLGNIFGI